MLALSSTDPRLTSFDVIVAGNRVKFLVPLRLSDGRRVPRRRGCAAEDGLPGAGPHGVRRQEAGSALPAIERISTRPGRLNTPRSIATAIRHTSPAAVSQIF